MFFKMLNRLAQASAKNTEIAESGCLLTRKEGTPLSCLVTYVTLYF